MLHTAPQLQQSAFGSTLDSINDDSLVIEAYVDPQGRVQDYRILSDSKEDSALLSQVKEEHAHLHHLLHLSSGAFDGQANDRAGDIVVLESQRKGLAITVLSESSGIQAAVPNKKAATASIDSPAGIPYTWIRSYCRHTGQPAGGFP